MALASAISSSRVLAGTDGCTSSTSGARASIVTPRKSRKVSYGRSFISEGLTSIDRSPPSTV
ncbi:Uncharacterised protein [Bordetella pertussis]|nr:Uncharacterised protein [Bordetella pertussis]CFP63843.1 Uncharacterised protein [Bordetella pertussis]